MNNILYETKKVYKKDKFTNSQETTNRQPPTHHKTFFELYTAN